MSYHGKYSNKGAKTKTSVNVGLIGFILVILFLIVGAALVIRIVSNKPVENVEQVKGVRSTPTNSLSIAFNENVYYQVSDIAWENNAGIAKVKVTTPDLYAIIADSIHNAIEECGTEDYDTLLEQVKGNVQTILQSEKYPILEHVIEMEAEKTENGYTLISNDMFEKIISGNIEEIFIQVLVEGLKDE